MVELGAGLGLPGLTLVQQGAQVRGGLGMYPCSVTVGAQQASLGAAQVTFTDRASVLPLLRQNVEHNTRGVLRGARCMAPGTGGVSFEWQHVAA